MKKILALLLALTMALSLLACGAEKVPAEPTEQTPAEEPAPEAEKPEAPEEPEGPTKVALIPASGTVEDRSVNQAAWEGVKEYCVANGVDYRAFEPEADTDGARLAAMQAACDAGFDVMVLNGEAFGPLLEQAQSRYPDTWFIAMDAETENPGSKTACVSYAQEQAVFLGGYCAVEDGFTKIGVLSSTNSPEAMECASGFVQGVDAAADPDDELQVYFSCGLEESVTLADRLEDWFRDGVALVFLCGDPVDETMVGLAAEHSRRLFGVDVSRDYLGQYEESSYRPLVTTTTLSLTKPIVAILTDLFAGDFDQHAGSVVQLTAADEQALGLATGEDVWGFRNLRVSDYEEAVQKLADGELTVTKSSAMPAVSNVTLVTTFEAE